MEQQMLDQGTDAAMDVESQVEATEQQPDTRTFTQEDLDKIVADRVARERKKFEKRFEGVDIDRYRQLAEAEEARKLEEQKRRGEFESVLKQTVEKKDSVIGQLKQELHQIKVDGNLLNAASAARAVNPQQVVRLLKDQVRLGETGEVEIIDPATGQVRYGDNGEPLGVNDLVSGFLADNPHFMSAAPGGAGVAGNTRTKGVEPIDPTKLDLNDPEQRRLYSEWRKTAFTNVRKVN